MLQIIPGDKIMNVEAERFTELIVSWLRRNKKFDNFDQELKNETLN